MFKVSLARSSAILVLALGAASCGLSVEGSASTSVTEAPTTTTTRPTTTTQPSTTTAAPTSEEISEVYCEATLMANAESIDYELANGSDATASAAYLDIGLSRMKSLELIPEEIDDDFPIAMAALVELLALAEATDDDISNEELVALFTDEVMDSIEALDEYEADICGFSFEEMALEAGLGPMTIIEGSELFVDPEGEYSIEVNPDWAASHGSIASGVELWFINDGTDGFAENLNLLTQNVGGITLEEYLVLSADSIGELLQDGAVLEQGIVSGSQGQDLGVLLYEGAVGQGLGTFLAVFGVEDGIAVVATFVALPDEFDELVTEVEDYMFTLTVG